MPRHLASTVIPVHSWRCIRSLLVLIISFINPQQNALNIGGREDRFICHSNTRTYLTDNGYHQDPTTNSSEKKGTVGVSRRRREHTSRYLSNMGTLDPTTTFTFYRSMLLPLHPCPHPHPLFLSLPLPMQCVSLSSVRCEPSTKAVTGWACVLQGYFLCYPFVEPLNTTQSFLTELGDDKANIKQQLFYYSFYVGRVKRGKRIAIAMLRGKRSRVITKHTPTHTDYVHTHTHTTELFFFSFNMTSK